MSLHIWVKVWNESFYNAKYIECHNLFIQNYQNIEIMGYELFNEIFGPFEQINEIQVQLLGIIPEMLVDGFAEVYVSTGGSGSSLGMPLG